MPILEGDWDSTGRRPYGAPPSAYNAGEALQQGAAVARLAGWCQRFAKVAPSQKIPPWPIAVLLLPLSAIFFPKKKLSRT